MASNSTNFLRRNIQLLAGEIIISWGVVDISLIVDSRSLELIK